MEQITTGHGTTAGGHRLLRRIAPIVIAAGLALGAAACGGSGGSSGSGGSNLAPATSNSGGTAF